MPQNNGLVEGKVNKLKLIKRMMFGRAEFPLLRQRVLYALYEDITHENLTNNCKISITKSV
ncbi:hypothetical protein Krac_7427 [Ktedonobacter racemifer DSM 44963]|uniref:Transposase n=1 Tax=Ktedonobacter racemifer DSM 44963 TaxID=485913 RepID=D6TS75_KTERA|nr:hypothetical protein Krac_7427 [Ktedonobacter racemifer DSM 44963]